MTLTASLYPPASRPYVAGGSAGRGDLIARFLVVASGNYVTGGDTLNLLGMNTPGVNSPFEGFVFSQTGYVTHYYTFIPDPASLPNGGGSRGLCKFEMTVASTQAELAAGAYPAGITGDTITAEVVFRYPE
jgi:hypothetical protein